MPNLLLGQRASYDVETIFNGEGGDPCFGGPKNHAMFIHQLYRDDGSFEEAYLRSYRKCYTDLCQLLPDGAASGEGRLLSPFLGESGMKSYLNRLMHINVRLKGADHILTKVNNLTRRNRLLGQSPLFDRRIVEASFAVPPAMKLRGAEEKIVLKRAVADLLPEAILTRPKSGMMVPVNAWTRRELRPFVDAVLRGSSETRSRTFPGASNLRGARRSTVWKSSADLAVSQSGARLELAILTFERAAGSEALDGSVAGIVASLPHGLPRSLTQIS